MSRRLLTLLLLLPAPIGSLQTQEDPPPRVEAVAAGILGSAAGLRLGARAGWAVSQGSFDTEYDGAFWGAVIGSVLGTALGTSLAESGTRRASFERKLRDAGVGLAVGVGGAMMMYHMTRDGEAALLSFSVFQGLYAGLSSGRW